MTPAEAALLEARSKSEPHWYCAHCGDSERAEPPYEIGDSEPCSCGKGVARVMSLKDAARISQRIALGWRPPPAYTAATRPAPATTKEG